MFTNYTHIFFNALALLALLAAFVRAESVKVTDGFEYETVEQMQSAWKITFQELDGAQVRLNTKDMKEGKQCLELILPPTKDKIARIILDVFPKIVVKDHEQVRFWLSMDRWDGATGASMLYWASADWKNYFYRSSFLKDSIRNDRDNWRKILVSRSSFKIDKGNPEMGNPTWDSIPLFRISWWIPANQPANRVRIDEVVWDSVEEKAINLFRKWWDE